MVVVNPKTDFNWEAFCRGEAFLMKLIFLGNGPLFTRKPRFVTLGCINTHFFLVSVFFHYSKYFPQRFIRFSNTLHHFYQVSKCRLIEF